MSPGVASRRNLNVGSADWYTYMRLLRILLLLLNLRALHVLAAHALRVAAVLVDNRLVTETLSGSLRLVAGLILQDHEPHPAPPHSAPQDHFASTGACPVVELADDADADADMPAIPRKFRDRVVYDLDAPPRPRRCTRVCAFAQTLLPRW